jgi:transcriptional regulator with XRE-family HTH domain
MTERLNTIQVGELLIELRNKLRMSQGDVAMKLGLANANFISMVERGKSNLPIDKFTKFMEVYEATPEQSLVIYRSLWPAHWDAICHIEDKSGPLFRALEFEEAYTACKRSVDTSVFSSSI